MMRCALRPEYVPREAAKISGTLGTTPITGKLTGDQISFTAASTSYTGRVNGTTIQGSNWTASRIE
jgi:hypothetical protein